VDDLPSTGALHVAFARSPVAHARIDAVDLADAVTVPGVAAVVTQAELGLAPLTPPMENPHAVSTPRPLLADGAVRFVGEPVAAVAADSRYAAEDAAELVDIVYDDLPVVSDVEAALDGGATVHGYASNVLYDARVEAGDPDAAFSAAAAVVERTFVNPRYAAMPIEPRGAVAVPDGEDLRLWSSTQAPHKLAQIVAELLGLQRDAVVVVTPDVGGGFGQKAHAYPEEIVVAWLARRLGRPLRAGATTRRHRPRGRRSAVRCSLFAVRCSLSLSLSLSLFAIVGVALANFVQTIGAAILIAATAWIAWAGQRGRVEDPAHRV